MKPTRWTKEESLLVLNLYFQKPYGTKPATHPDVPVLAGLLNRSPQAIRRRMDRFRSWYPALPFVFDTPPADDDTDAFWNTYFANPKLLHKEAQRLQDEFQVHILALRLYFQLIVQTMHENVPEVIELGRLAKRPATAIVDILHNYVACDPFIREKPKGAPHSPSALSKLVWRNYSDMPDKLENVSLQLHELYAKRKRKRKKIGPEA